MKKVDYNLRYSQGYMEDFSDIYEACRYEALFELLYSNGLSFHAELVVDYGCGQGRYLQLISQRFPGSKIVGMDLSKLALGFAKERYSTVSFVNSTCENAALQDEIADFIISVEVFEHVEDVKKVIDECARILKPKGIILLTTPCANAFSLEWFYVVLTGGFEPGKDGYRRFSTDEPGHLRRLKSKEIEVLFDRVGIKTKKIFFRTHLFTTIAYWWVRKYSPRLAFHMSKLDWRLFKNRNNGASMIFVGEKNA